MAARDRAPSTRYRARASPDAGRVRQGTLKDNRPRRDVLESCISMYPVVLDSALGPAHSGAAPARSLGKETTRGTLRAALDIIQKPAVEQGLLPV